MAFYFNSIDIFWHIIYVIFTKSQDFMKMLHLRLHPIHCFLSIVLSSFCFLATAQQINPLETEDVSTQRKWVEEKYNAMSLDEKIGQLYMVDVFSANQGAHTERVKKLIEDYHIGGIIFSKGGPMRQAKLTDLGKYLVGKMMP